LKHFIFLVCYEECLKRVEFDQILNNLSYLEMNLSNDCFEGSFFGTFFKLKNYVNKNIRSHIFIIGEKLNSIDFIINLFLFSKLRYN
jgi:hypothetical protein